MVLLHDQVFCGIYAYFIVQASMGQIRAFVAKPIMSQVRAVGVLFRLRLYSDKRDFTPILLRYLNKKLVVQAPWSWSQNWIC